MQGFSNGEVKASEVCWIARRFQSLFQDPNIGRVIHKTGNHRYVRSFQLSPNRVLICFIDFICDKKLSQCSEVPTTNEAVNYCELLTTLERRRTHKYWTKEDIRTLRNQIELLKSSAVDFFAAYKVSVIRTEKFH